MLNVAVFVSGRGSNLAALLAAKAEGRLAGVRFAIVFSDEPDVPAFDHARRHGIPTLHISPHDFPKKVDYETAVVSALGESGVDFIVLAGYMRIIGRTLLDAFPEKIINIHPSLLPSFPGLHAQEQAFNHGVKVSGCTVHYVDHGTDTGPIIAQRSVPVIPGDSPETLAARILIQEHLIFPEALELVSSGKLRIEGRRVVVPE